MQRTAAFGRFDLIMVVVVGIALATLLLLPLVSGRRPPARPAQNAMRLHTFCSGMRLFADGNRGFFPGLDTNGQITRDAAVAWFGSETDDPVGGLPAARVAILLEGSFIEPTDVINPIDSVAKPFRPTADAPPLVMTKNVSYAMLRIGPSEQNGRTLAWAADVNALAPLASDRNTGDNATPAGASSRVSSVWEEYNRGTWTGNVLWGDGRVTYENTHVLESQYPMAARRLPRDNLFADDRTRDGETEADAAMVYHTLGPEAYVKQRP